MRALLRDFLRDEKAATAIEYGIVVAVLSLTIVGGIAYATDSIRFLFGSTESALIQAFHK